MNKDYISVNRASELLKVTPHYVRQLLREGKLTGTQNKENGRWSVDRTSLNAAKNADLVHQDLDDLAKQITITIQDAVEDVEENFECTIVSYIANPNSPVALIDGNDAMLLDDLLYNLKDGFEKGISHKYKRIGLVLNSGGGFLEAAIKFVDIIRQYSDEYYVIVPIMAKSAATLIALLADKQLFTTLSELGPVDPVVQSPTDPNLRVPATAIDSFLDFYNKPQLDNSHKGKILKEKMEKAIDPYLVGAYKMAQEFSEQEVKNALTKYAMKGKTDDEISEAVKEFVSTHKSHIYPIMFSQLTQFGIGEKIPDGKKLESIKVLMMMYQQFMANSNIVKLIGNRLENKNIFVIPQSPTQQVPTRTSL